MNTKYEMSDIFDQPVCVRYGMSRNPLSVKPMIKSFGREGEFTLQVRQSDKNTLNMVLLEANHKISSVKVLSRNVTVVLRPQKFQGKIL